MRTVIQTLAACALLGSATVALPHVVLQEPAAAAGGSYRAAFQVGHGCAGSATTQVRVLIPEGFLGAQPMPKPGWTVRTRLATLAKPYSRHGQTITEDVAEVIWSANGPDNALPDAWFDEFVLRGTAPRQAGAVWFKVQQNCVQGQNDWSEVPASGSSTRGLKAPAVLLEVIDTGAGGHTH